ncbi:MAG: hypothetical protein WD063_05420 [Pirellulales bacterium]
MSTTSCPRCSAQVTLPVGVSNSATVRCPLCHAQYALADALVNMPPLLEVVDDASETVPSQWFDDLPADHAPRATAADLTTAEPLDFLQPPESDAGGVLPAGEESAPDQLEFTAEEADDDQPMQAADQGDQRDVDFGEPATARAASDDARTRPSANEEEMTLDFGGSVDGSEAETLAFNEAPANDVDDAVTFELDAPRATADPDAETIDFEESEPGEAGDVVKFDLDAPQDAATIAAQGGDHIQFDAPQVTAPAGQPGLREFGDLRFEASGEAEDIPLDLPDETSAVPVAADEGDEEESSAGTKKGKKKKGKAARSTNGKPKGSLVGSLVKVALPVVIAAPFALYLALWMGYDVAGLSGILPGFMLPAGIKKATRLAQNPSPASVEHTAARPAMPSVEPSAASETPADEPPAIAPADESRTAPLDATDSAQPDAAEPALPADNPFAPAASPAEMPENGTDAAANENPRAQPESPAAPPAKDESNPFASDDAPETAPEKGADAAVDDNRINRPASPDLPPVEPKPDSPPEPATKPETPEGAANPPGAPKGDDKPAPAADAKPAEDQPPELPTPGASEPLPAPGEPAQPVEALGPRNAQKVAPAQVMEALQATHTAGQQLAAAEGTGDETQLSKARANFYVTLFNMANAITLGQLGPGAAQLDPQLRALEPMIRQQLTADPKRFESLKTYGARWFAYPKRPTNGVVLAGTVESVDQAGKLYHARIKPNQNAEVVVTVVSDKDPQLAAGDEVLTLGSIVEQPADQLAGYEGSEPAVVWSGMTLKVSPAGK